MNYPPPPANVGAYSVLRQDAANARLGLQNDLWQQQYDFARRQANRGRRNTAKDKKYGAAAAALGGAGMFGSMLLPRPVVPNTMPAMIAAANPWNGVA
jgi:hypothetical protein